jgi:hypothetical protein
MSKEIRASRIYTKYCEDNNLHYCEHSTLQGFEKNTIECLNDLFKQKDKELEKVYLPIVKDKIDSWGNSIRSLLK